MDADEIRGCDGIDVECASEGIEGAGPVSLLLRNGRELVPRLCGISPVTKEVQLFACTLMLPLDQQHGGHRHVRFSQIGLDLQSRVYRPIGRTQRLRRPKGA